MSCCSEAVMCGQRGVLYAVLCEDEGMLSTGICREQGNPMNINSNRILKGCVTICS